MIGKTIAHYEITAKLGQGGMGEVYRATDTKLNRDVALKVLPPVFAQDEQRMGRFEREAQVLASLNHPNIASIYGLEEASGTKALAMELVEGEDLSDRMARGPIHLDEALPIALQIAEALEDAHEKGIIHRDLKPANVKLTPEGKVKVLDFGLAKALEDPVSKPQSPASVSQSPTLTMQATQAGIILGTAAYMAPEQARGKSVDRRADIWSFGVLLYEMLTGRRMFDGETISDSLAKVLQAPLDFTDLPETTPTAIHRLLRRCLQRSRRQRLRDIGDARIEIEEFLSGVEEPAGEVVEEPSTSPRRTVAVLAAVITLLLGLAIGWLVWSNGPIPELPHRRFAVATGNLSYPVISPDGRYVAYQARRQGRSLNIWLRDLDKDTSREIIKVPWSWASFTWSPTSDAILFNVRNELMKFSLAGGSALKLSELETGGMYGVTWSPDGDTIVLSSGEITQARLFEVSAGGGSPDPLLEADPGEQLNAPPRYAPYFLPLKDDRQVLLYTERTSPDNWRIMLWDMAGTERKELCAGRQSVYSPTGHILYEREGDLWALPFSIESLTAEGEPFLVRQGGELVSIARDGTLVYGEFPEETQEQIVWKSREGRTLGTIGQPQEEIRGPRISPDGKRVAVHGEDNDNLDIWLHHTDRNVKTRLTSDPAHENRVTWSPDGRFIVYSSDRNGDYDVCLRSADGSGEERLLYQIPGHQWAMDWSADGRSLVIANAAHGQPRKVLYAKDPLGEAGEPAPLFGTRFNERDPTFSPDGKYVAYTSDETGQSEVFVRRFPALTTKVQVSINGGSRPRWRSDGREIYFVQEDSLVAVPVSMNSDFTVGDPEILFEHSYLTVEGGPQYDVSADGQRFVVVEPVNQEEHSTIRLVQNWIAEFRDR